MTSPTSPQYKSSMIRTGTTPSNKSEEFPQILQPWWLSVRNFRGISRESFPVTDSSEILEKFPRIGPQDEIFLLDHSFELSFEKFLRNSPEFSPTKFLRISPEIFSGNSWEILRNFTPRNSWEILLNASLEIPEKFLGLGHQVYRFLVHSQLSIGEGLGLVW